MRTCTTANVAAVLVAVLFCVGCGSDIAQQVQQTATQVKESVTKTVDSAATKAQEQMNMAGKSEVITTDGPVKTPACYARFTPGDDGLSSVLALQSYKQPEAESFPAFYLQAQVPQASLVELVGKTVPAQMFLKPTADGPTWHTSATDSVQLRIIALADKEVTAELVSGTLTSSDSVQQPQPATGSFTAVLQ